MIRWVVRSSVVLLLAGLMVVPVPTAVSGAAGVVQASPSGELRVTTSPAVPSTIRVDGVDRGQWGLTWVDIEAGEHEVCFSGVPGFRTPPCEQVVVPEGGTGVFSGVFEPLVALQVSTAPAVPATISLRDVTGGGSAVAMDDWGVQTFVPDGRTFEVCFGPVAGFTAPGCEQFTTSGAPVTVTGDYVGAPGAPGPVGLGMLRVTTEPAVPSTISVDGEVRDDWGLNWLQLAPGSYEVCFGDVPGFGTPACEQAVVTAGATATVVGQFDTLGLLAVSTDPAVESTISVNGLPRDDWGVWLPITAGDHEVCFSPAKTGQVPVEVCQNATVTAGQTASVTGLFAAGEVLEAPPLPGGDARFVDAVVRDLAGREPSPAEVADRVTALGGGVTRAAMISELAGSDAFVAMAVRHVYAEALDRSPTETELTDAAGTLGSTGSLSGLWTQLLGGNEFLAMAGGDAEGFVTTAFQRMLKRDPSQGEVDAGLADLDGGSSRLEVASGLVDGVEGSRVRAKTWSHKLLSRDPEPGELDAWGQVMASAGDVAVVQAIASSGAYDEVAQDRVRSASLTAAPSTVILEGDQVVSAVWNLDGSGTIVVGPDPEIPAVGGFVVVAGQADPTAEGLGRVESITVGPGTRTLAVAAAGLDEVFTSGEVVDTTELTEPTAVIAGAGAGPVQSGSCSAQVNDVLSAQIGVDVANASTISWGLSGLDATVAVSVVPNASFKLQGSISASCERELWSVQWQVPIQVGPVTVPSYISTSASLGVNANLTVAEMGASVSLPCTLGVRATSSSAQSVSGCEGLRSDVTFNPTVTGNAKAYAKASIGYHIGVDKGWAKANIGLEATATLSVEAKISTASSPNWTIDAHLDGSLDLTGSLVKWDLNHNLAEARLYTRRLAQGRLGDGTSAGETTRRLGSYEVGGGAVAVVPDVQDGILRIEIDECTIEVLYASTVGGDFVLEVWDDGVLLGTDPFSVLPGGTGLAYFTLSTVVLQGASGLGIYISQDTTGNWVDQVDPYNGADEVVGCGLPVGSASGQVTAAATGEPVAGSTIDLYQVDQSGNQVGPARATTTADAQGRYLFSDVEPGRYTLLFWPPDPNPTDLTFQYLGGATAGIEWAETFVLDGTGAFSGLDAALVTGGSISGVVTRAVDSSPVEAATVCAFSWFNFCTETDADGHYTINGVIPLDYVVSFNGSIAGLGSEYFDDALEWEDAERVTVTAGVATTGIDAALGNHGAKSISGTVTSDVTGLPIDGACVEALNGSMEVVLEACTGPDGTYVLDGLPPWSYVLRVNPPVPYGAEFYLDASTWWDATWVDVSGASRTGVDFSVATGSAVTGRVTGEHDGAGVAGVQVTLWGTTFDAFSTVTDADGHYQLGGLPADTYTVEFQRPTGSYFVTEYWDDAPDWGSATPLTLGADEVLTNVDAALVLGGGISGTVARDADGQPVANAYVTLRPIGGGPVQSVGTSWDGTYEARGLAPGPVEVFVGKPSDQNLVSEYYDDALDPASATPVVVVAGQMTEGIDASLAVGGVIEGTVTRDSDGSPVEGVAVVTMASGQFRFAYTGQDGTWRLDGLPSGEYTLQFHPPWDSGLAGEFWNDVGTHEEATPIAVGAGEVVSAIDVGLAEAAQISGTVTRDADGTPVEGVTVVLVRGSQMWGAVTDADGRWSFTGVAPGSYLLSFHPPDGSGLVAEYHLDAPDEGSATVIAVPPGGVVEIDASLAAEP